jgi:hypothetical protein
MRVLIRYVLAFLAGAALAQRAVNPAVIAAEPIERTVRETVEGELEQTEQIFAYGVIAEVAKRSVDTIRFVDALLVGLLAAQAAIYAIYLDRGDRFGDHIVRGMEIAISITLVAFLPTFLAQEGPNPVRFRDEFPKAPGPTRLDQIERFVGMARTNSALRFVKLALFLVALALTVGDVVVARTSGTVATATAGAVQCKGKVP